MPHNTFATSGTSLVGYTLDNGRLELLSVLGLGAYGVVYLAVDLHAPTPVYLAVKCLLRSGLDSRQKHFQRREIALHQLASRHPNVVTLHKIIEEGDYVFVVMDFCDEGDLFGMITEQQRYIGHDALIKKVFLQIVDAVEYCHSMGIFHRDLKPENILCTRDGEKICIADFGLATSERYSTDFGCGSTFYLSPECQGGLFERLESYNTATNDLWSLGVILVNLTCGRNPWRQACPSDETFRAYVHDQNFLRTILPISHATNHILKGLFSLEPKDRMTLKDLRRAVLNVETFTMTDVELETAHSAARAAAAAFRPIPPVKPITIAPAPAPVPATHHHQHQQQQQHTPPHTPTTKHKRRHHHAVVPPTPVTPVVNVDVEHVDVVDIEMAENPYHPSDRLASWSKSHSHLDKSSSAFEIDTDILDTIDFTQKPSSHTAPTAPTITTNTTKVMGFRRVPAPLPPNQPLPQIPTESSSYEEPFDMDPLNMAPTSSQSSSSEDPSLPPTPVFGPADKVTGRQSPSTRTCNSGSSTSVPDWDLGPKAKTISRPKLLSVTVGRRNIRIL